MVCRYSNSVLTPAVLSIILSGTYQAFGIDDFDAKVVNSIAQNTGGSIGGSAAVALAGDIDLRVTANGANLDDTAAGASAAGQVVVLATIYDLPDFKDIVPAT